MVPQGTLALRASLALVVSVSLGLAGLALVSGGALFEPETYTTLSWDARLVVLSLGLLAAQWWLPARRLQLLGRVQGFHLGALPALLLHLNYVFGAAITPGGSGGGPALAAAWRALGLPWGRGVALALQIFVLDMTVLAGLAATGALYLVMAQVWQPPWLSVVLILLAAAALASLALTLAAAPRRLARLLLRFAHWRRSRRAQPAPRGLVAPRLARDYLRATSNLRRAPAGLRWRLWLVNLGAWLAHYAVLWALANLEQPTPVLPVLASLAIASMAALVVPTPGASGGMELLVGLGTLAAGPDGAPTAAILLWRTTTFYLIFAVGPIASYAIARGRWSRS
jgi:uncharacterized protein (TIRG00374 family)